MPTHAKPRRTAVSRKPALPAIAVIAKSRRKLAALAAAAVAGPALVIGAALPAHAAIPSHPKWESSAPLSSWNTGKFDIYNNEWNKPLFGPQTIWGYSYSHWGVESTQPDTTSVKTYPSVQENYKGTTLGSLHGLWSNFSESMPKQSNFDAEAAYDIWLNNYKIEVMVWFDNHGQRPAGRVIAHTTIYGQKFAVWKGGSKLYTLALLGKQESKGTAHLLKSMAWLESHGYLSSSDILTQVNFGWEICSTDGRPMDFTMNSYNLTTMRLNAAARGPAAR